MSLLKSIQMLKAGEQAPDFSLPATDGNTYSLTDFADAKALLIVFMCNHCPYVKPKIEVMKALQIEFGSRGFQLIGINSNDAGDYPEDSFLGMQLTAKEKKLNFPYLHDETQGVARAFGASCTPDPFLFNAERKLVYHGRFDDALEPGQGQGTRWMANAIQAILQDRVPEKDFIYSVGCSIKWRQG